MPIIKDFPHILHGGDWNPDQWIKQYPEIIDRDFELMDQAHCNTFSLGIFSWGQIETEEGKELLFPSIPECIKKVDVEKGEVTAHIMPGLLDLAK